ncbi:MAG: hypothetical protein ACR2RV_12490 [Verrucomicrobiales bacterium]
MKQLPLILIPLVTVLALASCDSVGGKNRYEYPSSKLSDSKRLKGTSLDGRFVILDDGSMWNIDWNDAPKARNWSSGDRVNVISTQRSSFPYVLIKQSNGERIAARYGKKLD